MTKRRNDAKMRPLELLKFDAYTADIEDDAQFVSLLQRCKDVLQLSERELGDAFWVSTPTITRWLTGTSDPHPVVRRRIYGWITNETTRRLMHLI